MKVLVIGSGAREHTLTWKLAQSPQVTQLFIAPGNAGTAQIGQNLSIAATDIEALAEAAQEKGIELVVVGPEGALAEGIVDKFQSLGVPIFGPEKAATQIESSKVFAKDLMQKHNIPCAGSVSFSSYEEARTYIEKQRPPLVIKADGLAAGKGVTVARTTFEALDTLSKMMRARAFGAAGDSVVIEECLTGSEMSAFAVSDGKNVIALASACDYKPVFDGNRGPNTGGMGSYSPPYFATPELDRTVMETIMKPTVRAMAQEKIPYKGVLYGGLMITGEGPKALEFNARFGDPETQVVLPRLKSDLVDIILAAINGKLDRVKVELSADACVGVVMTSGGYPDGYKTGFPITRLDKVDKDVLVFHAGTKAGAKPGEVLTGGGRVLTVVAPGKTIAEAREKVYNNIARIHFEGCHYRRDIGLFAPSR